MNRILAMMIALVGLIGCSCGNGTGTKGITGAYSKAGKLSEEEKAIFSEVVSPYVEPELKAEKVSRQVVAGTNYCFVCKDPDGKRVEVVVYVPLPGNGDPDITSVNGEELMDDFPGNSPVFITPLGKPLRVACIFHGSLAFEYDGKVIHIDPVTQMGEMKIDYSAFGKADAIFITHAHHDHLCPEAINALSDEKTVLFANAESVSALSKGMVLVNGDSGELSEGIRYTAVPAYNTTEGREIFHSKGNGNGYIFDFDGFRIYVAGDTEPIDEMSELGSIDLAFLPVNQPYTMTVSQCVEAAELIHPKALIPYHYSDTDLLGLPEMLKGMEVKIIESLR